MVIKRILKVRYYKAGYEVRTELVDGSEFEGPFEMKSAYTPSGDYIGNSVWAYRLCKVRGIIPEKASPGHIVCSIGFSEQEQKWYGWNRRALHGFGVGDEVTSEDHLCANSGWTDDYLAKYPESDKSLPVGFRAVTLDDAKLMAVALANAVG